VFSEARLDRRHDWSRTPPSEISVVDDLEKHFTDELPLLD